MGAVCSVFTAKGEPGVCVDDALASGALSVSRHCALHSFQAVRLPRVVLQGEWARVPWKHTSERVELVRPLTLIARARARGWPRHVVDGRPRAPADSQGHCWIESGNRAMTGGMALPGFDATGAHPASRPATHRCGLSAGRRAGSPLSPRCSMPFQASK